MVAAQRFELRTLRVWTACSSQLSYIAISKNNEQLIYYTIFAFLSRENFYFSAKNHPQSSVEILYYIKSDLSSSFAIFSAEFRFIQFFRKTVKEKVFLQIGKASQNWFWKEWFTVHCPQKGTGQIDCWQADWNWSADSPMKFIPKAFCSVIFRKIELFYSIYWYSQLVSIKPAAIE